MLSLASVLMSIGMMMPPALSRSKSPFCARTGKFSGSDSAEIEPEPHAVGGGGAIGEPGRRDILNATAGGIENHNSLLAGLLVGLKLYGRLDDIAFRKMILWLLLLSGIVLLIPPSTLSR